MTETWQRIPDYPRYLISNYGNVFNERSNDLMAMSKTIQGDLKVTLVNETSRVTRSVRVLVAESFVQKPYLDGGAESSLNCSTVIVMDNNKNNVHADNLAWRPAWFAQKYSRQFNTTYPDYFYTRKVRCLETGVVYGSILDCAMTEGLLFGDVLRSSSDGTPVFPYGRQYELF